MCESNFELLYQLYNHLDGFRWPGPEPISQRIHHSLDKSVFPQVEGQSGPYTYLYCAPCIHHISQAIAYCETLGWYKRSIKVDHRLTVGCCPPSEVRETLKLLNNGIKTHRLRKHRREIMFNYIDQMDIEQQIYDMETRGAEQGGALSIERYFRIHRDQADCAKIIIFVDKACFNLMMAPLLPMTRPGKEKEVYRLVRESMQRNWRPEFLTEI